MARCRTALLGILALPLTLLATPVAADTDVGGALTALTGQYAAAMAKSEDSHLLSPDSGAPGAVPSAVLRHAGSAVGTVTRAVEAAPKNCLPYSVRTLVIIVDEDNATVVRETVRFRMQWCSDGAHDIAPGEGACETRPKPLYDIGVGRCWWSKGLWGGNNFSFQTGAVYRVRLAPAEVTLPVQYATIDLAFGGVWYGPSDDPQRTGNCAEPPGLPEDWSVARCSVYATSDWVGVDAA